MDKVASLLAFFSAENRPSTLEDKSPKYLSPENPRIS